MGVQTTEYSHYRNFARVRRPGDPDDGIDVYAGKADGCIIASRDLMVFSVLTRALFIQQEIEFGWKEHP